MGPQNSILPDFFSLSHKDSARPQSVLFISYEKSSEQEKNQLCAVNVKMHCYVSEDNLKRRKIFLCNGILSLIGI